MAYYKYSSITRQLVEINDFEISPEDNMPVSFIEITKQNLLDLYQWDTENLCFVTKVQRILSKKNFLKRIQPLEYVAIKNATTQNSIVDYYWQMFMLAEEINLDDPDTVNGLGLLSSIGLIDASRIPEILA